MSGFGPVVLEKAGGLADFYLTVCGSSCKSPPPDAVTLRGRIEEFLDIVGIEWKGCAGGGALRVLLLVHAS